MTTESTAMPAVLRAGAVKCFTQWAGPNPSVVHLNALTASAAIGEIISWVSGCRAPAGWLDIDLQGTAGNPGAQIGPRRLPPRDGSCIACSQSG